MWHTESIDGKKNIFEVVRRSDFFDVAAGGLHRWAAAVPTQRFRRVYDSTFLPLWCEAVQRSDLLPEQIQQ